MKATLFLAAALSLGLAGAAGAQSAPAGGPTAKGNAPVKPVHTVNDGAAKSGHNSFTEGQARQHILNSGYTAVTGLSKGSDGVWRGRASKGGGPPTDVALDFKGNVTQGAAGMHDSGMHDSGMHGAMRHQAAMSSGAASSSPMAGGVVAGGESGMHHRSHVRHHHTRHVAHHHHHRHHHHGRVGMSGVDRNDNGISDKEDRARRR